MYEILQNNAQESECMGFFIFLVQKWSFESRIRSINGN